MNNLNVDELSYSEIMDLLDRKDCPLSIIERCLENEVGFIRMEAACHSNLSKERLKKLSINEDYYIQEGVLGNKNIDDNILDVFLKDDNNYTRFKAACHDNISFTKLKELFYSNDFYIRAGLCINKKTNEEMLDVLSEDPELKQKVVCNRNTSVKTLIKLYKEFPEDVLRHPNCPEYIKVLSK